MRRRIFGAKQPDRSETPGVPSVAAPASPAAAGRSREPGTPHARFRFRPETGSRAASEALRTLRTHRLRTVLTMFGLVWGTASIIFLLAWGFGVQRMLEDGYSRVGKQLVVVWPGIIGEQFTPAADRRWLWFTLDDVKTLRRRLRHATGVVGESRAWKVVGHGQRAIHADVRGVEPEALPLRGARVVAGRPIGRTDVDHRRRVAVLGDTARRRLLDPGAGVGAHIQVGGQSFEVVGFLGRVGTQLWQDGPTRIDDQVWIPLSALFAFGPRYGSDAEIVDSILVRLRERREYGVLKREVRAVLAERLRLPPGDDEAINVASPIDALQKLPFDQMQGVLFILGATTLVIGGVAIMNMMLDSVWERRHEIGVRLVVGARRRDILAQFFIETLVITGLGGLAGLTLGLGGCWLLARLQVPDLIPVPIVYPQVVGMAVGVMSLVGIASGILPAWRAAGVDPSAMLRAE